MKPLFLSLSLFLVIFPAACQHGAPTQPRTTLRVPEDIARDPTARLTFMERMRVQVLQKTTAVPPAEYQAVRSRLQLQLTAAGFDRQEADYILTSLQAPARAIQQASALSAR
jgi:hypothetical protein